MSRFRVDDDGEMRNELLAEIHNRLAEISKFLEVGIALFARLDSYEIEVLKQKCGQISVIHADTNFGTRYELFQDSSCDIGYNDSLGLHYSEWDSGDKQERYFPLGDYERTCPVDENEGYFLFNSEIESQKGNE